MRGSHEPAHWALKKSAELCQRSGVSFFAVLTDIEPSLFLLRGHSEGGDEIDNLQKEVRAKEGESGHDGYCEYLKTRPTR